MPGVINANQAFPPGQIRNRTIDFDPNTSVHWDEKVGDEGLREDTITQGECLSTLRGYVIGNDKLMAAYRYFLGWSEVDYTSGPAPILKRYTPAAHPEQNNIFAKRILVTGWKYLRKQASLEPNVLPRMPFAAYVKYYFQIDFQSVNYRVAPLEYVSSEWERFVTVMPADGTELVAIPAGAYIYKSNAPAGFQGKPVTLNAPLLRHAVERTDYKITIWQLPLDHVFNGFRVPRKLQKAKGKVNKTEWLGFPAQTFLFQRFEWDIYPMPVATDTWEGARYGCDIHIHGSYQEPDKAVVGETLAGWNLVPGLDNNYLAGWYGATTAEGRPMYAHIEANNLITHWTVNDLQVGFPA